MPSKLPTFCVWVEGRCVAITDTLPRAWVHYDAYAAKGQQPIIVQAKRTGRWRPELVYDSEHPEGIPPRDYLGKGVIP